MASVCATCASIYDSPADPAAEKPLLPGRYLPCCGRSICARCLGQNRRYETYCPYCQITTAPSLLPQGLRDPPAYSPRDSRIPPAPSGRAGEDVEEAEEEELPAYSAHKPIQPPRGKDRGVELAPDVLHFLTPNDSMHSLALAYGVPINVLRKANNVYADHLVQGRRTVVIPGEHYQGGVSLSPRPLEGEEEEAKKNKVRRWMMASKVAEYEVALLYLQQSDWHLESAIDAYKEDERWEQEHPIEAKDTAKKAKTAKGVGMRRFTRLGGNRSLR